MNTTSTPDRSTRRGLPIADLVLTAALTAVFLAGLVTAREWSFKAGFFPTLVTLLGLCLGVLHLFFLLIRRPAPDLHPHGEDAEIEPADVEYIFEHASPRQWAACLAWVAGFFLSMYLVGIFVTGPLFTLAYLRLSARASWVVSIIYAAVVGVALYLAFEVLLDLPAPPGLFLDI